MDFNACIFKRKHPRRLRLLIFFAHADLPSDCNPSWPNGLLTPSESLHKPEPWEKGSMYFYELLVGALAFRLPTRHIPLNDSRSWQQFARYLTPTSDTSFTFDKTIDLEGLSRNQLRCFSIQYYQFLPQFDTSYFVRGSRRECESELFLLSVRSGDYNINHETVTCLQPGVVCRCLSPWNTVTNQCI